VLGGFFAQHLHWSLIFWINLPLGVIAFYFAYVALRRLPRHERPHEIDVAGAVLMVSATVVFLLALSWGGTRFPWFSIPILTLLAAASLLACLFALRLVTAVEPLLPLSILLNPVVSRGTAAASFAMGTFIGLAVYVPIFFEGVLRLPASKSGVALIPLMAGVILGASTASRLMARLRHYKRPPLIGLSVAAVAVALLAIRPASMPFLLTEVLLATVGTGIGTLLPVATVAIQNAVEPHQLGTATGVMNFFRSLAGAIVVAGFGAIILGGAAASGMRLEQLAAAASSGAIDLSNAYRWTFIIAAAGLVIALGWLVTMAELPLRSRAPGTSEP
jgi:MFS family permease